MVHGLGLISRYFLGIVPKTYFASDNCVKFAKLGDVCAKVGEICAKIGEVVAKIGEVFAKVGELLPK